MHVPLMAVALLLAGGALLPASIVLGHGTSGRRRVLAVLVGMLAVPLFLATGYSVADANRTVPPPVHVQLFRGVDYVRDIRSSPRPLIIHVVTIDLDQRGIDFLVTPRRPLGGRDLPARTTSQFLQEFGVQVAINANFFGPWYVLGPFYYYPHVGNPVDVAGHAASRGQAYGQPMADEGMLSITREGQASIGPPREDAYNAVGGVPLLLIGGEPVDIHADQTGFFEPNPRTAVAVHQTGRRLLLFVVDGRQPNYSEGVTLEELTAIIQEYGGYDAVNLDGGGSSTLVMEGRNGAPLVFNSPIHGRIPPGRERPVANHLGIYARRL